MYDYLIIAEKKTLAEDIARAFKERKFRNGYVEAWDPQIGSAKIYWVFGHVLKIDIDATFKNAGYPAKFPVFPERLVLVPDSKRKRLVNDLKKEILKGDWKYVVNAGDPDREGELLVREVLEYFKVPESKVLRLWFNSQESEALRKALLSMKPAKEYRHVYVAGLARQIGDFWFGINGSRVLHRVTNNYNLSLGRVQTPVLKLIVDRYFEVKNFKPEDYYVVWIQVEKDGKKVRATYVKKEKGLVKKEEAQKVYQAIKSQNYAVVKKVEKKKHKKLPPNLYILSSLIRDAGKLGFSAQKTMSIVQKLYEHYRCISYPRTESCYLSSEDRPDVERYLKRLGYGHFVSRIPSRIFNDEDVAEAGHHAIIPTNKLPDSATREERLIYDLILKRFVAQFYPAYEYETTTVLFECGGQEFKAVGKVDLVPGWKEVYKGNLSSLVSEKAEKGKKNGKGEEEEFQEGLPVFVEGEKVRKIKEGVDKRQTTPPPLYTSSTLVAEMKRLGLGTEATRSTFESVLLNRGYVIRDKKNRLYPTDKGISLIQIVKDMSFVSPEYTSQWETMLDRIFKKKEVGMKVKFLKGVQSITCDLVDRMLKSVGSSEVKVLSVNDFLNNTKSKGSGTGSYKTRGSKSRSSKGRKSSRGFSRKKSFSSKNAFNKKKTGNLGKK